MRCVDVARSILIGQIIAEIYVYCGTGTVAAADVVPRRWNTTSSSRAKRSRASAAPRPVHVDNNYQATESGSRADATVRRADANKGDLQRCNLAVGSSRWPAVQHPEPRQHSRRGRYGPGEKPGHAATRRLDSIV